MSASTKLSLYNLTDLKNASDDAIANYLNSLKFRQSHFLVNTQLALGWSSFTVAAACFAWDYKLGWDATKHYTAGAVALYFLVFGVARTLWMLREDAIVYKGTSPSGEKITISTTVQKNIPIYNVKVQTKGPDGQTTEVKLARPFSDWVNSQGFFVAQPFQSMLATSIPAIGKYDVKNSNTSSLENSNLSPEALTASWADLTNEASTGSSATTAQTSTVPSATAAKKRSRSRKA